MPKSQHYKLNKVIVLIVTISTIVFILLGIYVLFKEKKTKKGEEKTQTEEKPADKTVIQDNEANIKVEEKTAGAAEGTAQRLKEELAPADKFVIGYPETQV